MLVSRRIADDLTGVGQLLDMLADHGDQPERQIPVAIETSRGLLVAHLRAAGRPVYAINPMSVARYRERSTVAGRKSDTFDARTLANVLRTDAHEHRPLPGDSDLVQAVRVLARAQQDAGWDRVQQQNRLRSHLRQYYPAFLVAYEPRERVLEPARRSSTACDRADPGPGRQTNTTPDQRGVEASWAQPRPRR